MHWRSLCKSLGSRQLQARQLLIDKINFLKRQFYIHRLGVLHGLLGVAGTHQRHRDAGLRQRPAQHELAQSSVFGFGQGPDSNSGKS